MADADRNIAEWGIPVNTVSPGVGAILRDRPIHGSRLVWVNTYPAGPG